MTKFLRPLPTNPQPKKAKEEPVEPMARTTRGLRNILFDEIDAVRNGKSSSARANAVARLAAGAVDTVRVEFEAQRLAAAVAANKAISGISDLMTGSELDLS